MARCQGIISSPHWINFWQQHNCIKTYNFLGFKKWHRNLLMSSIKKSDWTISLACSWYLPKMRPCSFDFNSLVWFFSILDPKITILDKSSIFVKQGGPINLSCSITARQYSPDQVKWYHNGTLIESHQTNWRLKNRTCTADDEEHCTIETLFSLNVKDTDYKSSGNFSCATDVLEPATVYVEILTRT